MPSAWAATSTAPNGILADRRQESWYERDRELAEPRVERASALARHAPPPTATARPAGSRDATATAPERTGGIRDCEPRGPMTEARLPRSQAARGDGCAYFVGLGCPFGPDSGIAPRLRHVPIHRSPSLSVSLRCPTAPVSPGEARPDRETQPRESVWSRTLDPRFGAVPERTGWHT